MVKKYRYLPSFSNVTLPLLFFMCFFVANAVISYYAIINISQQQNKVDTAARNINSINALQMELLKAETGQRGFLLTALQSYVQPYNNAIEVVDAKLTELRNADMNELQKDRFTQLQELVVEKLVELDFTIAAVQGNRELEAIQELFTHRGRNLMGVITQLVSTMLETEQNILEQSRVLHSESVTTAFSLILAANLVGVLISFISFTTISRYRKREHANNLTLQLVNDNLEERVKERTHSLQQLSSELERSNRELQDFAFVASHDLQEPLRKIRAFGDRLKSGYSNQLEDKGVDYIERMQKASVRMSSLITDLLTFSRISTEHTQYDKVDLSQIVKDVTEDLEISIKETNASIIVDSLPVVEADSLQMRQLFQNLISNALKYREPNVAPIITIRAHKLEKADDFGEEMKKWVEIQVIDNGIGFDSSATNKIFMPFKRLHNKQDFSGSGIGLAICRKIVEQHGGQIAAFSSINNGSTFTITLPLLNKPLNLEEVSNKAFMN